jgi:hypothetical protein
MGSLRSLSPTSDGFLSCTFERREKSLPQGLVIPLSTDGRFLRNYAYDTVRASRDHISHLEPPFFMVALTIPD